MSTRSEARQVVARIVREVGFKDPVGLRTALKNGYPFSQREGWPYQAWLAEIREQIGGMRPKKPHPNQLSLFD